jgi:3-phenylpropionate/cinnamic acid dioxygenase small subunit
MTLEELLAREAIRDTMAKYNTSGDRLKVEDYVACFTEDGIMESEYVRDDQAFRYAGKAEILAWQSRWRNREPDAEAIHKATFIRHHLSTCKIDLTGPDTAKARTYWVAWTDIGPDHAGYYLDDFRKVGDDWLIAHRRVRLDWESPDSLYRTAVTNTNAD